MDEITPRPVNLRPSICNFRPRRTGIGEKGSSTVVVGDGWDMFVFSLGKGLVCFFLNVWSMVHVCYFIACLLNCCEFG